MEKSKWFGKMLMSLRSTHILLLVPGNHHDKLQELVKAYLSLPLVILGIKEFFKPITAGPQINLGQESFHIPKWNSRREKDILLKTLQTKQKIWHNIFLFVYKDILLIIENFLSFFFFFSTLSFTPIHNLKHLQSLGARDSITSL